MIRVVSKIVEDLRCAEGIAGFQLAKPGISKEIPAGRSKLKGGVVVFWVVVGVSGGSRC